MAVIPGPWRVKCAKTARSTGKPCQRWAIRGGTVCQAHGGGGDVKHPDDPNVRIHPNAKTAATQRLAELRAEMLELGPLAINAVRESMSGEWRISELPSGESIPVAPAETKDRLKAAQMVLDRLIPVAGSVGDESPAEHRDLDAEIEAELEMLRARQEAG